MNITKEIITDLFPLYAANECSADTRMLVEEYLRHNPREAEELRRIISTPVFGAVPPAKKLDEMESLRKARRLVRRRSWLLGFAIFFSLAPFSFIHTGGRTYSLLFESPVTALIYAGLAGSAWIIYAYLRKRSHNL